MKRSGFFTFLHLSGMLCFLLCILGCLINILAFHYARELHSMTAVRPYIVYAVFFVLLFALGYLLRRTDTPSLERYAGILIPLFLCTLLPLLLLCSVLLMHRPEGDNALILRAAELIRLFGKIPPEKDLKTYLYMAHFQNQWGISLLLSFLPFKLTDSNTALYLISLIQSLLYTVSLAALLHTVRIRFGVRVQLMLAFCLLSFLPLYPSAAVLYTDTFSFPFVILMLCCILRIDRQTPMHRLIPIAVTCSVFLLIGCIIKMTCLILFFAASIVWLLTLRIKQSAVVLLLPSLILFSGLSSVNRYVSNHILSPEDAVRYKTPLLHWVMMSLPTDNNRYGSYIDDYTYTWSLMEQGASQEEVMQSIYTRIRERLSTFRSFKDVFSAVLRKNANYIGDGTFGMSEMLDDSPLRKTFLSSFVLYEGTHYSLYADLCGGIWLSHLTAAALLCLNDMRSRCFRLSIPMIAFLGMAIFELLWEARSRYLFNFTPLILLLSACSFVCLFNCRTSRSSFLD